MATILVVLCMLAYRKLAMFNFRNLISRRLMSSNSLSSNLSAQTVRGQFRNLKVTRSRPNVESNAHAFAAAHRTDARRAIRHFCHKIGKTPYYYQQSTSDQRRGEAGCRSHFWSKDMTVQHRNDTITDEHVIVLIDVDMYLNMPQLVTNYPNNLIIMFTVTPTNVGEPGVDDASHTFNIKDEIVWTVNGGSSFTHEIWNYSHDSLLIAEYTEEFIPRFQVTTTLVDSISISKHKSIVLITPTAYWNNTLDSFLANAYLQGSPLKRLKVVAECVDTTAYTRLKIKTPTGMCISTGRVDSLLSSNIPVETDDAIALMAGDKYFDLSSVKRFGTGKSEIGHAEGVITLKYHQATSGIKNFKFVDSVAEPVNPGDTYEIYTKHEPTKVPIMASFMNPILSGAKIPAKGINSELHAIRDRVEKPKNKMKIYPWMYDRMDEFVGLLLDGIAHTLEPVDVGKVVEKQNRPTQRRLIGKAETYGVSKPHISAFVKAESYSKYSAPRNISTIEPKSKLEYSMVQYALAEVLKQQPWYAFGKSNKTIAQRVADICTHANEIANTDFSKMDGHVNNIMRDLEIMILTRAFKPEFTEMVSELHTQQYNVKGTTKHGVKYFSEFTRASGSPETSNFNTIINAFIAYCTYRSMRVNGVYYTKEQAFTQLGIYGGDDGMSSDIDAAKYMKTAKAFGQELTIDSVKRHSDGIVTFLSRIYSPEVWHGNTDSCCDISRTLLKFHLCTPSGIMNDDVRDMKLVDKCIAYDLTDHNTPILSDFIARVKELYTGFDKLQDELVNSHDKKRLNWNAICCDKEDQYPNNNFGGWMNKYIPERLNVDALMQFLPQAGSLRELRFLPPTSGAPDVVVKEPMIVNGDLLKPVLPLPTKPPMRRGKKKNIKRA